jgi:hypothetical protein
MGIGRRALFWTIDKKQDWQIHGAGCPLPLSAPSCELVEPVPTLEQLVGFVCIVLLAEPIATRK